MNKLLSFRGVHWLATRFGWKSLRSLSFDEKFRNGVWNFSNETQSLVDLVEKYSIQGHILVLGCGTAPIAKALNPNSYETFLGIDLSQEAINIASQQTTEKIRFEIGDMVEYKCNQRYDVILFAESFYYVPFFLQKAFLRRMSRSLTPTGKIIVTLVYPEKFLSILKMVRRNFTIEVDEILIGSERHVLVFR